MSVRPIDLRRAAGYRKRKRIRNVDEQEKTPQSYRIGRSYSDYLKYIENENIDQNDIVELDTVKGRREKGNVLMTMFFRRNHVMIIFLLPDGTQESVLRCFDFLEKGLGLETFMRLFKVILTDNGSEFKNIDGMELNAELMMRTHVFYCDPMASWQKGMLEKNHEYIRYAIPKGTSLNKYSEYDITLLMNHINSTRRPTLNNNCPYDLVADDDKDMQRLMRLLKMEYIPAQDVNLTSKLFRK